ncbi:MAG: DUF2752 domain-containing protein [Cyanobacteria bacterium J06623_7]
MSNSKFIGQKRVWLFLLYSLATLGLIMLRHFDPAAPNTGYPPSLSREWGGFYCAGCGMFRALHQLLNGNLWAALRLNPLLVMALPYFIYLFLPYHLSYFHQIHLYTIRYPKTQLILIAVASWIYGILRNLTIPALFWLTPPS